MGAATGDAATEGVAATGDAATEGATGDAENVAATGDAEGVADGEAVASGEHPSLLFFASKMLCRFASVRRTPSTYFSQSCGYATN